MSRLVPRSALVLALLTAASALVAQDRRPLTHDDYDQWKSLRGTTYTQDGSWVAFQIEPQWGDGVLEVKQTTGSTVYRHDFASAPRFSADGRYLLFTQGKSKVEERNKKIDELRKKAKEGNKPGAEPAAAREGEGEENAAPRRPGAGPGGAPGGAGRGGAGGRRGPGGGGPPGAGGDEGAASRDRGELMLLELATGKVEKIGRVKGSTLSDDVAFLLIHKEKPEARPARGETRPDAPKAEGAAEPQEEPKEEPKKTEPAAGEPAAEPHAEPAAATEEPREGARRGGNRRGPGAASTNRTPTDPLEAKRPEGTELIVRDLATGKERTIADVVGYGLSRNSKLLWYHTSAKKPAKDGRYGLFVQPLAGGEPVQLLDGIARVANVTFDRAEQCVTFTSDKEDFAADKPASDLYLWEGGSGAAKRIAWAGGPGMPAGKRVAGGASFTRDGGMLTFDVQDAPAPEPLPILPEDKVTLDLWNWRDGTLQTAQSKRGGGERSPQWTAVWHRNQNRLLVLGDDSLRSLRPLGADGRRMIGTDGRPYEKETTWDGRYADVWLVDSASGQRTRLLEKLRGNVSSSPDGKYLVWFDASYRWQAYDVATGTTRDLTGGLGVPFHRHDDDHPEPDGAYGIAGWTDGDREVVLYDEFDVWKVAPATGTAVCVTDGHGRNNRMRLRIQQLPRDDDRFWLDDELLLAATNVDTMAEGFLADSLTRQQRPQRLLLADKNFGDVTRPKKSSRLFFTQSTFAEFPDLWTAASDFTDVRRLSDANPQQKHYRWGRAELVRWIDGDGAQRQGVLVKPDDFDPTKKYPMLVHFYERMTQGLHSYSAPSPGTSPNAAYYVSNGYLWFMPDVVYEIGYPGASCVKCVVSGVQHLLAQGFVDEKGIGAAGHSWGGYQTAFLVTRTNIFAAVESGAPVSNMVSAYGGIRYESGVSRQFQYEMTQSRIGGTPWQFPLRYHENSPIHFADKVKTPVLILHNDQDGAVPWTQGIEYFTALRRLGKECYLFNYNGEGHGLRNRANQKDWSRRMAEYFAHHLKKEPAPKWMLEGVPYFDRDVEKLPFAQSYIDAHVKPAPVPAPTTAPVAKEGAVPTADETKAAAPAAASKQPAAEPATAPANVPASKPAEAVAPAPATAPAGRGSDAAHAGNGSDGAAAKTAARAAAGAAPASAVGGAALQRGAPAPQFAVRDETGTERRLADYAGKRVLLWFYPRADTPGCTRQGCGLRDQWHDFEQRGVAVLGVSTDPVAANASFRQKLGLPFPLLCDTDRAMAVAYGAADDAKAKYARRIAVLIGADGRVEQVWSKVDPDTFAATALAALPE
jgi:dipeptidyl aminopeptidase/acylaminoacyl peptidase/peroxiredoxin